MTKRVADKTVILSGAGIGFPPFPSRLSEGVSVFSGEANPRGRIFAFDFGDALYVGYGVLSGNRATISRSERVEPVTVALSDDFFRKVSLLSNSLLLFSKAATCAASSSSFAGGMTAPTGGGAGIAYGDCAHIVPGAGAPYANGAGAAGAGAPKRPVLAGFGAPKRLELLGAGAPNRPPPGEGAPNAPPGAGAPKRLPPGGPRPGVPNPVQIEMIERDESEA